MSKVALPTPVNETQRLFAKLCELGGGKSGGPAYGKVLELLRSSGKQLNGVAYAEMAAHMKAFPDANPWHVCFAVGLCWGHLAQLELDFTKHVVSLFSDWNSVDLSAACEYCMERGPDPIEQSLTGGFMLFEKVRLPATLPTSLELLSKTQERWLGVVLSPDRPRYIGSWNATAMFMTALFAQPALAATQKELKPVLPPGGPIFQGLKLLHKTGILSRPPDGSQLDDEAFEPGALYVNNALLVELCRGLPDWCLTDVHSGVYMLGTRHPHSDSWF